MNSNTQDSNFIRSESIDLLSGQWLRQEASVEPFALRKTPLLMVPRLGSLLGLPNLYLKWEGANSSGSQKDRIAVAHLQMAQTQNFRDVVAATCGNYGRSLALNSIRHEMTTHIYLPASYLKSRLDSILHFGGHVTFCKGSYEEAVEEANQFAEQNNFWNASPGAHPDLEYKAYQAIADEIREQLQGQTPDIIAVPASNGVTVVGIAQGFKPSPHYKTPHLVAGTTDGGNPILTAFQSGSSWCKPLDAKTIIETETNSPLVNWKALAGNEALQAIYQSKGYVCGVSDPALKAMSHLLLKTEGLCALPAATSGLCALIGASQFIKLPKNSYVIAIITAGQN